MFDINGPELLTILIVALIVVGPRRLPELTRRLGGWTSEIRRAVRDLRSSLDKDVQALKEPLEEASNELEKTAREASAEMKAPGSQRPEQRPTRDEKEAEASEPSDAARQATRYTWVGPEPVSGPTAADALEDLDRIERAEEVGSAGSQEGNEEEPRAASPTSAGVEHPKEIREEEAS